MCVKYLVPLQAGVLAANWWLVPRPCMTQSAVRRSWPSMWCLAHVNTQHGRMWGCVGAGRVEGVLWYFPYENDQETVPLDPHTMGRMLLMANRGVDAGSTQNPAAAGGLRALTQLGGPTQVAACQTQRQTQAVGRKGQAMEQDTPELEAAGKGPVQP